MGKMIRLIESGHQYHRELQGEAIAWGQTVEVFDGAYMQVPCVTLDTGAGIEVVPLKTARTWVSVEPLISLPPAA